MSDRSMETSAHIHGDVVTAEKTSRGRWTSHRAVDPTASDVARQLFPSTRQAAAYLAAFAGAALAVSLIALEAVLISRGVGSAASIQIVALVALVVLLVLQLWSAAEGNRPLREVPGGSVRWFRRPRFYALAASRRLGMPARHARGVATISETVLIVGLVVAVGVGVYEVFINVPHGSFGGE